MDNRGFSALKLILAVAAVLVAVILAFFIGQMGGVLVAIGLVVVVAIAMLFNRSKTPTD